MARRMKANTAPGFWSPGNPHTVEHDENSRCSVDPTCQPIEETPMTSLTDAVNALPSSTGDAWLSKKAVLAFVKDKVVVPNTGTYVVASGEVYEATKPAQAYYGLDVIDWEITVVRPKPTFFEAGKTYSTKSGVTFRVIAVEKDGNGRAVAIGVSKYSEGGYEEWTTRRHFEYWEEVK